MYSAIILMQGIYVRMIKIDTQPIVYYSSSDERHFFAWAQEIDCITSIDLGYLHIDPNKASDDSLRDLLALLERYRLASRDLSALSRPENEHWFKNPNAYWYESVFGNA